MTIFSSLDSNWLRDKGESFPAFSIFRYNFVIGNSSPDFRENFDVTYNKQR